jgi:hypothetical protein
MERAVVVQSSCPSERFLRASLAIPVLHKNRTKTSRRGGLSKSIASCKKKRNFYMTSEEKQLQQQFSSVEDTTLSEDDLAGVAGGIAVSSETAAKLAQERGPVVKQSTYGGLPVTRFANGETIAGFIL